MLTRDESKLLCVIFGATSMNDVEPIISIWSRKRENAEASIDRPLGTRLKSFLRGIVQLALAIALIAYVSNIFISERVMMNASGVSFTSLGNAWQEYSKLKTGPHELTNDDIHIMVDQYIEDRKMEQFIANLGVDDHER
ncbi:hypothetical protein AZE42_11779 [Rhizopogon vesiculosus]|uniref:Uncharacterized protein n=1 Tax=Rhizopogon vesiculosus TaxID=180088 RepID=A0A1J8PT50_9AGAM|nr:hypothetical protein AZE42_11779 [Rhizopogon vesiculosus]